MSMIGSVFFVAGAIALMVGAEMVVRGASKLAALLGIKPLVIGLTIVAVGTSMPELAVGIIASQQGSGSLAVGNIAGTNMFNILFILGLSSLILPLLLHLQTIKLDLPMMIVAAALMTVLAWDGAPTRLDGGLLLGVAVLYTIALLHISRRESQAVVKEFEDMCGIDSEESCDIDASMRKQRDMQSQIIGWFNAN